MKYYVITTLKKTSAHVKWLKQRKPTILIVLLAFELQSKVSFAKETEYVSICVFN